MRIANDEVDIASLAVFRIGFGALMFVALVRFWAKGFFEAQLIAPSFHFTYEHFSFVRPLPQPWLSLVLVATAACALGVALGLFYRACAVLFALGFLYLELLERSAYLNHYYLVSLLSFLLACLPAGDALSLDALRRGQSRARMPTWMLWTLRTQLAVVYVFAGLAKLNPDWLLRAQPLRIWLAAQRDFPLLGPWLGNAWSAYLLSWAGAAFDLSIVGFLLWRPTRGYAYAVLVLFHLCTGLWFPIGMFPWIMALAATLFFAPDWPRRYLHSAKAEKTRSAPAHPRWLPYLFGLHLAIQLAVPLYQHTRGFDAAWTGQGFDFAWKVMLAERAGVVSFRVRDHARNTERMVSPGRYLTPSQAHAMAQDPALVRSFARHIAADYRARGQQVSVYADAFLSLNGRPAQRLIDPTFDLASPQEKGFILARSD